MLEIILGSKTKIRAIETMIAEGKPLTRHEVVKKTGSGLRTVYEQIEELETIGIVVRDQKRRYTLNENYSMADTIHSLTLLALQVKEDFLTHIVTIIHDKLHPNYYLGGYTAAIQLMTPIDFHIPLTDIRVTAEGEKKAKTLTRTLGKLREIQVGAKPPKRENIWLRLTKVREIPEYVSLREINGQKCNITGVEHGIIEMWQEKIMTDYEKALILIQNKDEGILNEKELIAIGKEHKKTLKEIGGTMAQVNQKIKEKMFNLPPGKFNPREGLPVKAIEAAVGTLWGNNF